MEMVLFYDGELRPRQQINLRDVHRVRAALEPQIRKAWEYPPLDECKSFWNLSSDGNDVSTRLDIGHTQFISVVAASARLHAELDIQLLRAQPPGSLVSNSGDIDNRLKTLLDALRVPSRDQAQTLQADGCLAPGTFCCLLEDDHLVTKMTVSTDRLLTEPIGSKRTVAIIRARVRLSSAIWANISLV